MTTNDQLIPIFSELNKTLTRKLELKDISVIQGEAGRDGVDGKDGKDGVDGQNGEKGERGESGLNGKDGKDGLNGKDGVNGKDGEKGEAGKDGKDASVDTTFIKKLQEVENIAKMNALPQTTMFVNGKRSKNLSITGATVNTQGDTTTIDISSNSDVILTSPNGTQWALSIGNDGVLITTSL